MTITKKLLIGYGALVAILMVLSLSLFLVIDSINAGFEHATLKAGRRLAVIQTINTARADVRASLRAVILYTYAQKPDLVDANRAKTEAAFQDAQNALAEYMALADTSESRDQAQRVAGEFKLWDEKFQTVYSLCKANNPVEGEAFGTRETKSIAESVGTDIGQMQESSSNLLAQDTEAEKRVVMYSKLVNAFSFLLSLIAGAFVLRMVLLISKSLGTIATDLSSGSEQLTSAASQISSTAQSLAQGASEQAASLQETSTSSHEVVSMTKRNAENSKSAMQLMTATSQEISVGNERLGDMRMSMNQINSSAEKISKIIRTIDEIAFQTNILALNAAVEAARAGEAGMGFAVVAEEVRNLAQRSAQAAKDTASLIEEAIRSSREGTEKLGKVEQALEAITGEAEKVHTLITEVSMSSDEQARALEKINHSVSDMEVVTQRAAAGAEESAAAGEELNSQAHTLYEIVRRLEAMVHSGAAAERTAAAQSSPAKPDFSFAMAEPVSKPRASVKPAKAEPAHTSEVAAVPARPSAPAPQEPSLEAFLLQSSDSGADNMQEWR